MSPTSTDKSAISGYECRFAVYCPPPEGETDDYHLVKENVHLRDGTTYPNVRLRKNFKRPFWITKVGRRNHKDKKEWEHIDNLIRYETTQSQLLRNIPKALGDPGFRGSERQLYRNPYIYGADITSTAVIKQTYRDKFPDLVTAYSYAAFDTETDVLHGTNEIIMGTLSFKNRVVTAIRRSFVEGYSDVIAELQKKLVKYIGEYVEKRKIEWEVVIVDTEAEIVTTCFARAHEWKPDIIGIWNIDFDIPKSMEALQRAGIEPKEVFSDPIVPSAYRHFTYKKGNSQKITASGKITPIKPVLQWHSVHCPSSFMIICAQRAYRQIRNGEQEEFSYSLDAILDKELGIRKLSFKEADGFSGIDKHMFMQEHHPLEYIIYNVFDCVSMEELDEKTTDLCLAMPMFSGCSDFYRFPSQPRRSVDALHTFVMERNHIIGTTSDQMTTEFDKETVALEDWIVTLPAHLVMDNGLCAIDGNSIMRTNIRPHTADLDVAGSYPNGECVFNISKETTHREIIRIVGVPLTFQRRQGINLSAGHVNAVEFCCELYDLPTLEEMLKAFEEQTNATHVEV